MTLQSVVMSDIHDNAMVSFQNALLIYFINILHQQTPSATTPEAFMTKKITPNTPTQPPKKVKWSFRTTN